MPEPIIKMDEWLTELERVETFGNSEGMTTADLVEASGRSERAVRKMLAQLKRDGRIIHLRKKVSTIRGFTTVDAYAIRPKQKGKR